MNKFSDQLFDDLMQKHGPELATTRVPTAPRRRVAHPVRLAVAGGVGAVAIGLGVGLTVPGSGTLAYAVTANANGTVTLDVYSESGIAGANAALRNMGDGQVVVVPVEASCRSITSLPLVSSSTKYMFTQINGTDIDPNGKITLNPHGTPKGDIVLVPVEPIGKNTFALGSPPTVETINGAKGLVIKIGVLTRPGAPSCVSVPESSLSSTAIQSNQG
jgi:hypothetical protein